MVDSALLDQGGEVEPSQTCPHLHACLRLPLAALPASIGRPCEGCGSDQEAWVCLSCGATRCSRYVNACAEAHFFESMSSSDGDDQHHALVLSLSDLSVWCYACASYVKHDRLLPLLVHAEATSVVKPTTLKILHESKFNAPEKRELLQGAQTSFHVHFSAPPALLRPPSATAAEDDGGGGGGKPTSTELAVEKLKERFLLAKAVCLPPPPSETIDAIVGPLAQSLLLQPAAAAREEDDERPSCALAVVGEGGDEGAVEAAVAQALVASGRPGTALLLHTSDGVATASLASSPPSAAACPLVVLHVGGGGPSSSQQPALLALARRLASRAAARGGPPLLVVVTGGCSAEGVPSLLVALLEESGVGDGGAGGVQKG